MPNWVYNKVHFYGEQKEIDKLKKFVKSKESVFDFNKIIPMPEELNLESGSHEDVAVDCALAKRLGFTTSEKYEARPWSQTKTFDEWAELGEKYLGNIEKYGHPTWYTWCCDKWGTKWNACDADWSENDVEFNTAWSAPTPIFEKLSQEFPKVYFNVSYADEDLGRNNGTISWDGDSFTDDELNDFDFACEVWGYDPEEMREERDV